ncbi:MAG: hypothetical protein JWN46_634 [Acidimicrobiales bacterium]|nr:hypothetical protein [Acidimicrobiales bacterium]
MLRLRRPSAEELAALATRERDQALTYPGPGVTATGAAIPGYEVARYSTILGTGTDVFDRARAALQRWAPQRGSGIAIEATGPIEAGAGIAFAAPLPVAGFVIGTCRVVYVEDAADRWAFAYGTLPLHPASGEERFAVVLDGDEVRFEIEVVSRPQQLLARLAPPVTRLLQRQAIARYLRAMETATSVQ